MDEKLQVLLRKIEEAEAYARILANTAGRGALGQGLNITASGLWTARAQTLTLLHGDTPNQGELVASQG